MKASKTILTGALALSVGCLAEAQTVIRITGSTAFRAATHTAITNCLQAGFTFAYSGADLAKASQAIFTGVAKTNGAAVVIKASWSGSVGGVQTVSQQLPISTWLVSTTPQGAAPAGTPSAPAVYDTPTPPDVAMSDSFQNSSGFASPVLHDTKVGVVPFKWVASLDAPANLNLTPKLAQNLFRTGKVPLAMFTGATGDETNFVYATGRDPDSGTRLTAFAESGVGVFTVIKQYQPTITGASGGIGGTVQSQALWPAETVNGISVAVGNGGSSGGGALAQALTASSKATLNGFYLSYLGISDANNTALAHGAHEVSWNGFYYSTNAVQEGQYSFWGYEHLLYRSDYAAPAKTVADSIASQLINSDAVVSGILLNAMNVSRPTDGGAISVLY